MRKGMVIAGAVILIIGVAALSAGFYLILDESGLANLGISAQKTTLVLAPGASGNIGVTQSGKATIVAYSDNTSAAVQVTSAGSTPISRTSSSSGSKYFVDVFATLGAGTASAPIVMHNNQTKTVSVQYAAVQTGIGALAYGGISILAGGLAFIVGLIVLVVGLVLKKPQPPGQQQNP